MPLVSVVIYRTIAAEPFEDFAISFDVLWNRFHALNYRLHIVGRNHLRIQTNQRDFEILIKEEASFAPSTMERVVFGDHCPTHLLRVADERVLNGSRFICQFGHRDLMSSHLRHVDVEIGDADCAGHEPAEKRVEQTLQYLLLSLMNGNLGVNRL